MKVLDIITESPKVSPDAIRNLSPDEITQFLAYWSKNNKAGASATVHISKDSENFFTKWIAKRQFLITQEEARVAKTIGWAGPLIKVAGFLTTVAMWRCRMLALNDQAAEKNEDGTYKYSAQQILAERNNITGMFVTVQLMSWALSSIKNGPLIAAIIQIFKGSSKALLGRGGVWAAAIVYLTGALAEQALKAWLTSDAGRAWFCQNFIVKMIVGEIGSITEDVIGGIVDSIHSATGLNLDTTPNITQREKELPKLDIPQIDPKAAADADMKDRINRYTVGPDGKTWATRTIF
jgi:hypothetical protein